MRYFKESEFIMGNEIVYSKMNVQFLTLLDELRERVGEPLKVNSSYRSLEYNASIGGASKSKHMEGIAVDLHCTDSKLRVKIVGHAIQLGLTVGIGNRFIHCDNRNEQIMFTY